ncbi:NB-ARC domain-containing protein, partial [candidate division KSB1 bacterium]
MSERKSIPLSVKREILIECGHRCAVCGTPTPLENAHIIPWHKTKDNCAENLICLCANCHERSHKEKWDKKTLQEYKQRPWVLRKYDHVPVSKPETSILQLTIDIEFEKFDDKEQRYLKHALAGFLGISPDDVKILDVTPGSAIVNIEIPLDKIKDLTESLAKKDDYLAKFLYPLTIIEFRKSEIFDAATYKPVTKKLFHVPHKRNVYFTGRQEYIDRLHDQLNKEKISAISQKQAVCGLGGIGKTQIAVEYAYRYKDDYTAVFWVKSETKSDIDSSLVEIAGKLNLPEKDQSDQLLIVNAALKWFEENNNWLLIFDNADEKETLKILNDYIPSNETGNVIVTSRADNFHKIKITHPLKIDKLDPDEAFEMLRKHTGFDAEMPEIKQAAEKLVKELGYFPLAISQAAAYICAKKVSLSDYLDSYRKKGLVLLEEAPKDMDAYEETVLTTWSLNFDEIEKKSEASAELLKLFAFLNPDEIPCEILTMGYTELGPVIAAALGGVEDEKTKLHEALAPLTEYSLIEIDADNKIISIHRLVQDVIKSRMNGDEKRDWAERIVNAFVEVYPEPEFENWGICERLHSNAQIVFEIIIDYKIENEKSGFILNQISRYSNGRGLYNEGITFMQRAIEIGKKTIGEEHPNYATRLN